MVIITVTIARVTAVALKYISTTDVVRSSSPTLTVLPASVVSELAVVDPAVLQSKLQSGSRQMQVVEF